MGVQRKKVIGHRLVGKEELQETIEINLTNKED